jgi:integrase/recombinase XerD
MANRKVRIVRDVKLDGEWTTLSLKKAQKLKIPAAEGRWYITWREGRRIKRELARDHGRAIELQSKKHAELHATAFGIKITPDNPNRMRLDRAFDEFIEDQELLRRADKTVDAYRAVKRTFLQSCRAQFLDEVTRRDLLQYAEYLRKREGLSDRTVHTRWTALMTVLKHHNVRGLAKRGDTPRYVEEEPQAYTQAELDALFKVCKPDYHLLFTFYLRTGFRMQEVMYLKWADINFETATVRVKAKPEFGFVPKRWHERSVPLGEGLLRRLEERRKHRKAVDLVFPTRNGKPNGKHLVALKRLARKAKQDQDQFWLHKFRASAATGWLRAGIDVRTVQKLLGHRSLNSTLVYLQPLQVADIGKSAAWKAVHAGV